MTIITILLVYVLLKALRILWYPFWSSVRSFLFGLFLVCIPLAEILLTAAGIWLLYRLVKKLTEK